MSKVEKNEDIKVICYRRPNMFKVNDNMFNMLGVGELKKLYTIENYVCEKQALELYYPERFLNIAELRALHSRIIKAKNYTECRIVTSSPFVLQCSKNIGIAEVAGEILTETQFKLSWDDVGLPDDGGLNFL